MIISFAGCLVVNMISHIPCTQRSGPVDLSGNTFLSLVHRGTFWWATIVLQLNVFRFPLVDRVTPVPGSPADDPHAQNEGPEISNCVYSFSLLRVPLRNQERRSERGRKSWEISHYGLSEEAKVQWEWDGNLTIHTFITQREMTLIIKNVFLCM